MGLDEHVLDRAPHADPGLAGDAEPDDQLRVTAAGQVRADELPELRQLQWLGVYGGGNTAAGGVEQQALEGLSGADPVGRLVSCGGKQADHARLQGRRRWRSRGITPAATLSVIPPEKRRDGSLG